MPWRFFCGLGKIKAEQIPQMGKGIFLLDLPFTALYKNGIYITEFYTRHTEGFRPMSFPVFSFINSCFL
jgi:hypothetical protein